VISQLDRSRLAEFFLLAVRPKILYRLSQLSQKLFLQWRLTEKIIWRWQLWRQLRGLSVISKYSHQQLTNRALIFWGNFAKFCRPVCKILWHTTAKSSKFRISLQPSICE